MPATSTTVRRGVTVAALAAVLALTPACSSSGSDAAPPPAEPVRLTESGGCGNAFLWATTPEGDVAVTVTVEARDRSATEPTTIAIDLPDPDVTVKVLRGTDLASNFCTDLPRTGSHPTDTQDATAGTGSLVLDPTPDPGGSTSCGRASGHVRLRGVVASEGTRFAPIDARSDQIGCYSG